MITLFRRIREKLIASGSVTKYLLYATGEILLVVIGILIALQVNNWNEEFKNQQKLENYTNSLITDLAKDSVAIARTLEVIEREAERFRNFQHRLTRSDADADTVYQIFQNEFDILVYRFETFNNNTLNVITTTGDIELFPDALIERFFSLTRVQVEAIKSRDDAWENFRSAATAFAMKYPFPNPFSLINSGPIYEKLIKRNEEEFIAGFNAVALNRQNFYRVSEISLRIVQDQTHQLLTILKEGE